jgi:hypothetical protein
VDGVGDGKSGTYNCGDLTFSVYICICIYTHMHIYIHTYIHTHIYIYAYIWSGTYNCGDLTFSVYTHTHTHTHTVRVLYTYVCESLCVCVCGCVCVCVYVCMCVCVCVYTYTQGHTLMTMTYGFCCLRYAPVILFIITFIFFSGAHSDDDDLRLLLPAIRPQRLQDDAPRPGTPFFFLYTLYTHIDTLYFFF